MSRRRRDRLEAGASSSPGRRIRRFPRSCKVQEASRHRASIPSARAWQHLRLGGYTGSITLTIAPVQSAICQRSCRQWPMATLMATRTAMRFSSNGPALSIRPRPRCWLAALGFQAPATQTLRAYDNSAMWMPSTRPPQGFRSERACRIATTTPADVQRRGNRVPYRCAPQASWWSSWTHQVHPCIFTTRCEGKQRHLKRRAKRLAVTTTLLRSWRQRFLIVHSCC